MKTTLLLLLILVFCSPARSQSRNQDNSGNGNIESISPSKEGNKSVDGKSESKNTPVKQTHSSRNQKTGVKVTNNKPNTNQNEPTKKIDHTQPNNNPGNRIESKTNTKVINNTKVDTKVPDKNLNTGTGSVNVTIETVKRNEPVPPRYVKRNETESNSPVVVTQDQHHVKDEYTIKRDEAPGMEIYTGFEMESDSRQDSDTPVFRDPKTHSNPLPHVTTDDPSDITINNTQRNTNTFIFRDRQYYRERNNYYYDKRPLQRLTKPESSFMLGVLTTTTNYPDRFNLEKTPVQSGFQLGSKYNIHKIEDISMGGIANLGINLLGSFILGFASGTDNLIYTDAGVNYDYITQHYTFVGDLFSLSANAEYKANVFADRGVVLGLSVTFFNLGGTASYMRGGRFDEEVFGTINILPLYIQPYAKIKFLGGTLGAGLLLNPYNFAEYRFGPEGFYGEGESGFHTNSSKINRYAIEAYFKF